MSVDCLFSHNKYFINLENTHIRKPLILVSLNKILLKHSFCLTNDVFSWFLHLHAFINLLLKRWVLYFKVYSLVTLAYSSNFVIDKCALLESKDVDWFMLVEIISNKLIMKFKSKIKGMNIDLASGCSHDKLFKLRHLVWINYSADVLNVRAKKILLNSRWLNLLVRSTIIGIISISHLLNFFEAFNFLY